MTNSKKSFSAHPAVSADRVAPLNLDFATPFEGQVKDWFTAQGDLRGYNMIGLPGQAVAAVLALAVVEMATGLPVVQIFQPGAGCVGEPLDLNAYRHQVVRPRRVEIPAGEAYAGHTVLDGAGRGVTDAQLAELKEMLGEEIRVVNVAFTAEETKDLATFDWSLVADRLVQTGLTQADWTSGRVIFLPPGLGFLGAVMAAAIHGLSEAWPRTIRLNKGPDGGFHVDEIVDPQALRQFGVALQAGWSAQDAPVMISRASLRALVEVAAGVHAGRVEAEGSALGDDDLRRALEEADALLQR